jgi:hypothetical protein
MCEIYNETILNDGYIPTKEDEEFAIALTTAVNNAYYAGVKDGMKQASTQTEL